MSAITRRQIICAGATLGVTALGQLGFYETSFAAQPDVDDEVNRMRVR